MTSRVVRESYQNLVVNISLSGLYYVFKTFGTFNTYNV